MKPGTEWTRGELVDGFLTFMVSMVALQPVVSIILTIPKGRARGGMQ